MESRQADGTNKLFVNKQERESMKRKGAQGLPADPQSLPAANEEFATQINGVDTLGYPRSTGWDPYEVWRTRVKSSSRTKQAQELDSTALTTATPATAGSHT
jgi:hypothetical protein